MTTGFDFDTGFGDTPKKWMSQERPFEKVDPIETLGEFNKRMVEEGRNSKTENGWTATMDRAVSFSEPVKTEAVIPAANHKGKPIAAKEDGNPDEREESQGIEHDWKVLPVYAEAEVDGEDVGGDLLGWIFSDGEFHDVTTGASETIQSQTIPAQEGARLMYFHVERDPASRAVTSKTVELHDEAPFTGQSDQYFLIAVVGGDVEADPEVPIVVQKQFTPIRVFEQMVVANGEFKLVSLATYGDNMYGLPI